MNYYKIARIMLAERNRLGVQVHDLHALRYRGVMELAWAGCDDDEIMSYSGHKTKKNGNQVCWICPSSHAGRDGS